MLPILQICSNPRKQFRNTFCIDVEAEKKFSTFNGYSDDNAWGESNNTDSWVRYALLWRTGVPTAIRSDNDQDNQVVSRRARWCGVVFALSATLTVLNVAPPFDISYRVRSEVVVSAARLDLLEETSQQNAEQVAVGNRKPAQLVGLKVLDTSRQAITGPIASEQEIALVEFDSVWSQMCSKDSHAGWIKAITRSTGIELQNSDLARQHRMAQWELATAEHYKNRHEFLTTETPTDAQSDGKTFSLATHSQPSNVPAGFASFTRPATGASAVDVAVHEALEGDVENAKSNLENTEVAWKELVDQSAGLVEIASEPEVSSQSHGIPIWMTLSILFVGIASGSLAGWIYFRLQSAGGYVPSNVADHLSDLGIPIAGTIHLPLDEQESRDPVSRFIRLLRSLRGILARNLIVISETTLGFWVLLIILRLSVDDLWRQVFVENPLAAFGRVAIGLP